MKKYLTASVLVVGILLLAPAVWFAAPRVQLAWMGSKLQSAGDAETVASVVRDLLKVGSADAIDVVNMYADKHEFAAFDRPHRLFLVQDLKNGRTHLVDVRPQFSSDSAGEPVADEILNAIHIEVTSPTIRSQPPEAEAAVVFRRIYLAEAGEEQVDFVLGDAGSGSFLRLQFRFDGQKRDISMHDVTAVDLERWRQRSDWPSDW